MKINFLICVGLLCNFYAVAQQPIKSILCLGLDKVYYNDNIGGTLPTYRYNASYTRFLKVRQLSLQANVGFISHYIRERASPFDYYYLGDRSRRIQLDLNVAINVIKSKHHMLKAGIGPTVWFQRNSYVENFGITTTVGGNDVDYVSFIRRNQDAINLGINVNSEYSFMVVPNWWIGIVAGLSGSVLTQKMEISTISNSTKRLGVNISHSF